MNKKIVFQVEAVQAGIHPNAETKVTVIVNDKNDHKPIFQKSNYVETIDENSPLDTSILTVSDIDIVINGV